MLFSSLEKNELFSSFRRIISTVERKYRSRRLNDSSFSFAGIGCENGRILLLREIPPQRKMRGDGPNRGTNYTTAIFSFARPLCCIANNNAPPPAKLTGNLVEFGSLASSERSLRVACLDPPLRVGESGAKREAKKEKRNGE